MHVLTQWALGLSVSYVLRLVREALRLLAADDAAERAAGAGGYTLRLMHDASDAAKHPVCNGYFTLLLNALKKIPELKSIDTNGYSLTDDFAAMIRTRALVRSVGSLSLWVRAASSRNTLGIALLTSCTDVGPPLTMLR